MIQVSDLDLNYGKAQILKNVDFEVPKGALLGLIGPNGAGKSSLIKVLAGLVHPSRGSLKIDGVSLAFKDLRKHTGYTIDTPSFYPELSALQNLRLLEQLNGTEANLSQLLDLVGLKKSGKKKVKAFSTGMKQRLAIAASLISSPELLILDEPFNGLDPGGYRDLWDLLLGLNKKGRTIIISSHLLADLEAHATHFLLINEGEIAMALSKKELVASHRIVTFYFQRP
jgi:ABC-2 type transport system ATP-binding protein